MMEDFVRTEFGGAKLFLVDQTLVRAGGHYLTYNRSLMEAAKGLGLEPWILAGNMLEADLAMLPNVMPVFSGSWHTSHGPLAALAPSGSTLPPVHLFTSELMLALRRLNATRRDHVFIHTVGFYEAVELHRTLLQADVKSLPRIHFLCRRDLDEAPPESYERTAFELAIQGLCKLSKIGLDIRFYTDTPELSLHYSQSTGVRFVTLPLPFGIDVLEAAMEARAPERAERARTQICYLGDARDEKGYQHIPAVIDGLPGSLKEGQLHFVLQSNFNQPGGEPQVARARARMQTMPRPLVDLRLKPLSDPEYFDVLASSDAVFLAYNEVNYARRSSGVFTESLYAGVIPIVPAGTSMAAQLPKGFPSIYSHAGELPGIVADLHTRKHELKRKVAEISERWRELHSPKNLLLQLLCAPPPSRLAAGEIVTRDTFEYGVQVSRTPTITEEADRPPVCVHVVDLESVYWKIGAGYVKRLQASALTEQGILTFAVMIVHKALDEASQDPRLRPSYWARTATLIAHELGYAGHWIVYRRTNPSSKLPGIVGDMASRSLVMSSEELMKFLANVPPDFVYSNYAQNYPVLQRCGLASLPFIVETHDVQAHHAALYDREASADADAAAELEVYQRARAISCLTQLDEQYVRENGIVQVESCLPLIQPKEASESVFAGLQDIAELLSASGAHEDMVNIGKAWASGQTDQLIRLFGEARMNMLFVGGWHKPNIEGLQWFHDEVFKPFLEPAGKNLFVIGGIFPERARMPSKKIFWAGICDRLDLPYASAEIVIAPLLQGTGVNIKILEALAWGKPLVATSIALRGIHGAAELLGAYDEPEAFARRVLALSEKTALRREAAHNSRKLYERLIAENDYNAHVRKLVAKISPHAGEWMARRAPTPATAGVKHVSGTEWSSKRTHIARYVRQIIEGRSDIRSFTEVLDAVGAVVEFATLTTELSALYESKLAVSIQDAFLGPRLNFPRGLEMPTAHRALRGLLLRAIDVIYAPMNKAFVASYGAAQSVAEIVASVSTPKDARRVRAFEMEAVSGVRRSLQTGGFDFLIWNGHKGVGESFTAWLARDVIATDPSLRDATFLVVGGRASTAFASLNIVHIEDAEQIDPLMLVAKTLILPARGINLTHPHWLRAAVIFASAGKTVLSSELGLACEGRPSLTLGQDRATWAEAMQMAMANDTSGDLEVSDPIVDAEEVRDFAPSLGIYTATFSGLDLDWSPAHAALGAALAATVGGGKPSARNERELRQRLSDNRFVEYAEAVIGAWLDQTETQQGASIGPAELAKLMAVPTLENLLSVLTKNAAVDWVKTRRQDGSARSANSGTAGADTPGAQGARTTWMEDGKGAKDAGLSSLPEEDARAALMPAKQPKDIALEETSIASQDDDAF
jgi:hypothetical protein